tara:strand:+ start:138 stop:434 length:297 start_codon:yes stop_codon:yes gene_type:complete
MFTITTKERAKEQASAIALIASVQEETKEVIANATGDRVNNVKTFRFIFWHWWLDSRLSRNGQNRNSWFLRDRKIPTKDFKKTFSDYTNISRHKGIRL